MRFLISCLVLFLFFGVNLYCEINPGNDSKKGGKMISKEMLEAIRDEKEGFKIGKPWRYNEKAVTCVLPIIRETVKKREYITFPESENVKIADTGNISLLTIENNEEHHVFIRMGEIFKGESQERASVHSRIIESKKKEEIKVQCIHQSRGISSGTIFTAGGYVPDEVVGTIFTNDQHRVWNSVEDYSANLREMSMSFYSAMGESANMNLMADIGNAETVRSDDLTAGYETYSKIIDDVLKNVPSLDNQVGLVVIDRTGFYSLEAFDVKESWQVLKNSITKGAGVKLSEFEEKEGVFVYKPENSIALIMEALSKDFIEETLFEDEHSKIIKLSAEKLIGEVTLLDDDVIHLWILRD